MSHEVAVLERTWAPGRGLWGWLTEVHHKPLGRRYIVTAFVFFALGGLEALLMRMQLSGAERNLISNDLYNQLFTVHGSTMMFLFAVPIMQGIGFYLVPLMVGTRNLAFPRLGALSYYLYLIGGLLLYAGFIFNVGPDTGWFAYVPLSGPQYAAGKRVDIWAQMITFTELSALAAAVNLIATIFKHRAPGMSLGRMPLFVWAMLVQSFMVIFAMPAIMLASLCLALDRLVATHFFNPAEGGDALLWQHLFWFFGHPEVYLIMLPALGMMSEVVGTFSRRPVVGNLALVLSLLSTAFLGFGLWVHHMFATGLPQLGESFFTAASFMIAIPTGVQIFCWIATLWTGRPQLRTPLLWCLGFFAIFVLGGVTGIVLASVPLDLQVHDTQFVVAHLHYVLIGGAVFPLLGGLTYWFPKITGRLMDERLGDVSFVLAFIGFNLVFFPLHQLGLEGMPRRVYTYLPGLGWEDLNQLALAGVYVLGAGVLLFVGNALVSMRTGKPAGDDPWHAGNLEWSTSSPPPAYNFAELPTVRGRYPRWIAQPDDPVIVGVRSDRPEVLVTDLLDAKPDHLAELPGPAISPFIASLGIGVTFIASIFTPWGVVIGAVPTVPALVAWFWPKPPHREDILEPNP
jgi:cytochrome c oxidase subunit I+III